MKKQFTFHEDASHGWLEVSYKDVTDVDIHNEISEVMKVRGQQRLGEEVS